MECLGAALASWDPGWVGRREEGRRAMRTQEGVTAARVSFLVGPRSALLSEACPLDCRPQEANEAAWTTCAFL